MLPGASILDATDDELRAIARGIVAAVLATLGAHDHDREDPDPAARHPDP